MLDKKLSLIGGLTAASLLSAQAFAWDGFYVAGSLQFVGFDQEVKSTLQEDFQFIPVTNVDLGDTGYGAEVALGYGLNFSDSPWALDVEVFYNENSLDAEMFSNVPLDDDDGVTNLSSEVDYTYGIRIKPGYFLAPNVKLFAPLGFVQTRFKSKASGLLDGYAFSNSTNEDATGFQFGVGIETMLNEDVSVAVSVTKTYYEDYSQSFTVVNDNIGGVSASNVIGTAQADYNDTSITTGNLTFIYRF